MSKRFAVVDRGEYSDGSVALYFEQPSRAKAIAAFRTLYGEQPSFVLFEQVACTDPVAGPRDEADDASGKASVQQDKLAEGMDYLHSK